MTRRRRTDFPTAALVMELGQQGKSTRQIAAVTGVSATTVSNILNGEFGWGQIAEGPVFQQYRAQQNKALEVAARALAAKAYAHAEEVLPKANFLQSVIGGSTLVDKARLLAGESTENHAHYHVHEIQGLDRLCERLRRALIITGSEQAGKGGSQDEGK